ncbi:MAG: cation:proton antiporter [Fimbriimonadaceae bacterium]|nr:cation:proton antiporter [Fimbriimonadaceae bacterium]
MHETQLISMIAAGLGLAFALGLLAARLKLPLLVGYLAAGLAIGPFTPGFVADKSLASQLSEIGVSLLMFGVGLHFSIRDLLSVRAIAIPGALVQIAVATLLGAFLSHLWGWGLAAGLVFGLCLSVASTVVLLRALSERGELDSVNGRIAVGWLIVEDLVTVAALVALPVFALPQDGGHSPGAGEAAMTLLATFAKVAVFAALMLVVGKKLIPKVLGRVARSRSKELFTIGVLATALGIAFGSSALFGVSPALGAFFAGVVLSESDLAYHAGAETRPVQDAFTVLFFVAIGMLFNPAVLTTHPLHLVAALGVVLVGKSVAAFLIVVLFKQTAATALTISASLAQIGEFSFVLVALGIHLGILPTEALSIVVATAIASITLNPAAFRCIGPIERLLSAKRLTARLIAPRGGSAAEPVWADSPMSNHVIVVGYGGVGRTVTKALVGELIPFVVVDADSEACHAARREGHRTVFGDATRPEILRHADVMTARQLVLAVPASAATSSVVASARETNPGLVVSVRTHDLAEAVAAHSVGAERVVSAELELALQLAHFALESHGRPPGRLEGTIEDLRASEMNEIARLSEERRGPREGLPI